MSELPPHISSSLNSFRSGVFTAPSLRSKGAEHLSKLRNAEVYMEYSVATAEIKEETSEPSNIRPPLVWQVDLGSVLSSFTWSVMSNSLWRLMFGNLLRNLVCWLCDASCHSATLCFSIVSIIIILYYPGFVPARTSRAASVLKSTGVMDQWILPSVSVFMMNVESAVQHVTDIQRLGSADCEGQSTRVTWFSSFHLVAPVWKHFVTLP